MGTKGLNQNREPDRWLLVIVSSAGASSTLRVAVWRRVRSLGGLYLQQSVCLLPYRAETVRAVTLLLDRVQREGGEGRALPIAITDHAEKLSIVKEFNRERTDEYNEVVSRTPAFLAEIEQERARGRATYTEVEESEADLTRLRTWVGRVRSRDYFGASGLAEAEAAVESCSKALTAFEAEALAAEVPDSAAPNDVPARHRRLSVVRRDSEP